MKPKNPDSTGYPEYSQLHLPSMEKEILLSWEHEQTFEKSIASRPAERAFVFYEGPPSANGKPGIHHVMSRTIKDIFCRFKTLQGYRVERKAGWDTHGLPVELNVEKQLGITKNDIGTKISVAEYNAHCRADVMKYTDEWKDLTQKMGYWVDLEHPYITYENNYIESLWSLLKMLYEKDMLYKGFTIQPYSPAAGTGLSSHELNQPGCYKDVKDITAVAMFKVVKDEKSVSLFDSDSEDVRILAWTTTPWTLPSNVALAVGAEVRYVKVKTINFYTKEPVSVILADDLLEKTFAWNNLELLSTHEVGKGATLAGIRYEQLLPFSQPSGRAFEVIVGDFVTTTDGTGVVHISPVHGADDMRVARQQGIVTDFLLVDKQGRFTDGVGEFSGEYVKEAYYTEEERQLEAQKQRRDTYLNVDIRIVDKLKKENKLFKSEKYEHTYPHCWRTDKPVIYYPLDSWFIRTTAIKDRLIELNKTINWKPSHTGEGRFGQWLENLVDWNLSRTRYWGTPLPIWRTNSNPTQPSPKGKASDTLNIEAKCIGSVEELKIEIEKSIQAGYMKAHPFGENWERLDLHKPFVDDIVLVSDTGAPMYREPELIDVWFDSGAMPYAQNHWPFAPLGNFPADFIAEGVDQTRGWFFTLHVLGVALFDSVAYKNVVSNGLLLDKNGNKMSKRLGNIVDPFETLELYSADATRWYMMRNSDPWDNTKFDPKGIEEVTRAHFGTLHNTYGFFALYANLDQFKIDNNQLVPIAERTELDQWILSKLESLLAEVTALLNDYEPTRAARAIETFVDEHLSNWYVRLSRRRFWKGEMSRDKQAAYETLHHCLAQVAQLMSPFSPFYADWLYQNLMGQGSSSVHLSYLPEADQSIINPALELRMELAQRVTSLVLSLRKKVMIKVRQPLSKILIPVLEPSLKQHIQSMESYILSEVNVKTIEYVTDTQGIVTKKVKPNFKTLGKKAGANMKLAQEMIVAFSQEQIAEFEANRSCQLEVNGQSLLLDENDLEIMTQDIPGWLVASDNGLTVALDITITEPLKHEGTAREFVNKIQNLRKDKDFQVLDRITVEVVKEPSLAAALALYHDYVASEILANSIMLVDTLAGAETIEFNDTQLQVMVKLEG